MKEIYSQDNKIYKLVRALESRKHRDRSGTYLIEGTNAVVEAAKNGVELEYMIFRADYKEKEALAEGLSLRNSPVIMAERLFNRLSQTENSRGVLAVAFKREFDADEFFRAADGKNIVISDRLQDPGNIGAVIRTADAAGYGGMIALKGTGDIYAPKVVRAAAGSVFRLPVLLADTPAEAAGLCKKNGKRLVASCIDADKAYYEADIGENIALIIGNEGRGISDELVALADTKVKIPMSGNIDSLNAAVAAGILMYEAVRK